MLPIVMVGVNDDPVALGYTAARRRPRSLHPRARVLRRAGQRRRGRSRLDDVHVRGGCRQGTGPRLLGRTIPQAPLVVRVTEVVRMIERWTRVPRISLKTRPSRLGPTVLECLRQPLRPLGL